MSIRIINNKFWKSKFSINKIFILHQNKLINQTVFNINFFDIVKAMDERNEEVTLKFYFIKKNILKNLNKVFLIYFFCHSFSILKNLTFMQKKAYKLENLYKL